MNLNSEQLTAIRSTAKTVVMPAGPGSGKTRTVVGRVKFKLAQGMDPREMMILTFTNAGANVFATRLMPIRLNYMGTVHGYCMRLIQTYGHLIGYRPNTVGLVTEEAKKYMLAVTRERLGRKITDKELHEEKTLYSRLIWQEYRYSLKRANMCDYDQILVDGLELLRMTEVREKLIVRELLGDELQDSGPIDWDIIWAIPAETRFLVGDVDQSIYSWRGGSPEIFMHADQPEPRQEFPLTLNYRSDIDICTAANNLIRHNLNRIDKPIAPVSEDHGLVAVRRYDHEGAEIYGVWGKICELVNATSAFMGGYNEIAVLARTNSLVEKYRETLRGLGLPIKRIGGVRLPADWSYALTLLSLLVDPANDFYAEEVLRHKGHADHYIGALRLKAMQEKVALSSFIFKNVPVPIPFDQVLQSLAFFDVSTESLELIKQRIEVLPNDNPTISDLLADLWRNDTWNVEDKGVGVTVCTIHAAKGKEWDVVFVVALEEGVLPQLKKDSDIEEERRLCFVAITRARHMLFLSHAAKRTAYFKEHEQQPSRFISEMDL